MKSATWLVIIGMVLAGCSKQIPKESDSQRYRREANAKMAEYCSNSIVGHHRTVSMTLMDWGTNSQETDNPNLWRGRAEVEFVNRIGGRERTNLAFHFILKTNLLDDNKTYVGLDYAPWIEQESKRQGEEFDAWRKLLDVK